MKRFFKKFILMSMDSIAIIISAMITLMLLQPIVSFSEHNLFLVIAYLVIVNCFIASIGKVYSVLVRFTDSRVLVKIGVYITLSYALVGLFLMRTKVFSVRFFLVSLVLSYLLMILPRICWRVYIRNKNKNYKKQMKQRVLVVGAGEGGSKFIKTTLDNPINMEVICVIDDDLNKLKTELHGKQVVGNIEQLSNAVSSYDIDLVVIAIPTLSSVQREKIIEACNGLGIPVKNMPNIEEVIAGNLTVNKLRDIDINDLLGREEVTLDTSQLGQYFSSKTVLITGAGGSIGSEICRQVAKFKPNKILLLGHGENSIYQIHRELDFNYRGIIEIVPIIADIQDRRSIQQVMETYKPDLVYHAAAHKHVPLMEYNPKEAVKNNIFGTKNVAELSKEYGVAKFVMVSTDKALNPPNVMGATKRVAEMIVTNLNEPGKTQFSAVRFGNVLGSRGSVVPLFKEQIAKGGPVTVTDFRMTRYFMTIPEASRLVIQSGYLAKGGEVFVLDMGQPVKIKSLAEKVIKLSGYSLDEIEIVESGIRPGEKLYEELLTSEELVEEQIYDKIFIGRVHPKSPEIVESFITQLLELSDSDLRVNLIEFARQNL